MCIQVREWEQVICFENAVEYSIIEWVLDWRNVYIAKELMAVDAIPLYMNMYINIKP